jgi:perosamine synthetase
MASLHLSAIHIYNFRLEMRFIVPAQTHVATVHAVELSGRNACLCRLRAGDGQYECFIDGESKITSKTKAIFLVHFAGIPMEMDKVCQIAARHKLKVVEDCALGCGGLLQEQACWSCGEMWDAFRFIP